MHYYKREIKAYGAATARLTFTQHGIYCLLIDACYDRERCPVDVSEAAEWLWVAEADDLRSLEMILNRFFDHDEQGYNHPRIEKDLAAYHAKAAVNKANGARGGRPKRNPKKTETVTEKTETKPSGGEIAKLELKSEVNQVVDYWRVATGNNGARATKGRIAKINARLKEGYSITDIKAAIDGCAASGFHMGRDPKTSGKTFNDLELICRNGEKLESFMKLTQGARAIDQGIAEFLGGELEVSEREISGERIQ